MSEVPSTSIIYVTPEIARDWLKFNYGNRPLRSLNLQKIKSDMLGGRWRYAGDPLRFAKNGRLMDGAHRLTVMSQMPDEFVLPFAVIRGLDDEIQLVMDQGTPRTAGDQLNLLGFRQYINVASAARLLMYWQAGLLWGRQPVVSNPAIVEWAQQHPDDVERVIRAMKGRESVDCPASVLGCMAILFGRINDELAMVFLAQLFSGSAGGDGNPINTLDKRLSRIRRLKMRVTQRDYMALFIQAWNAWVSNKPVYRLQIPEKGWSKETFPDIISPSVGESVLSPTGWVTT